MLSLEFLINETFSDNLQSKNDMKNIVINSFRKIAPIFRDKTEEVRDQSCGVTFFAPMSTGLDLYLVFHDFLKIMYASFFSCPCVSKAHCNDVPH